MSDLNLHNYVAPFEPEWLKPAFILKNDEYIVKLFAQILIGLSGLVFLGIPGGGFMLFFYILD